MGDFEGFKTSAEEETAVAVEIECQSSKWGLKMGLHGCGPDKTVVIEEVLCTAEQRMWFLEMESKDLEY